jgi:hypothetical protein
LNQNRGSIFLFDALSLRQPASTPDQVRGRPSLENARRLRASHFNVADALEPNCVMAITLIVVSLAVGYE